MTNSWLTPMRNDVQLFLCVCLGFYVSLKFIWRCHHFRWRAVNFKLCSAIMAIEQWRFLSVSYLLWNRAFLYDGQLRGPLTVKPIAEHLAVYLSIPVFMTSVFNIWWLGFSQTPNIPLARLLIINMIQITRYIILLMK